MLHVISRNDELPKGISHAHVTVYEGGKGKPPPAPAPMLALTGPPRRLCLPAPAAGGTDAHSTTGATTTGPRPNPWIMDLPPVHPEW